MTNKWLKIYLLVGIEDPTHTEFPQYSLPQTWREMAVLITMAQDTPWEGKKQGRISALHFVSHVKPTQQKSWNENLHFSRDFSLRNQLQFSLEWRYSKEKCWSNIFSRTVQLPVLSHFQICNSHVWWGKQKRKIISPPLLVESDLEYNISDKGCPLT